VLLADEDEAALVPTARLFEGLGHRVLAYAVSVEQAAQHVTHDDPDLAVVVLHHDDDHALELIDELSGYARGPVIALLEGNDPAFLAAAAERGINAFAQTDEPDAVRAVIEVALRRHAETTRLSEQVEQLSGALERRGTIERAKGILMERHRVDERAAFGLLRDHARGRNRRVVDVARAVLEGHGLLPGAEADAPAGGPAARART